MRGASAEQAHPLGTDASAAVTVVLEVQLHVYFCHETDYKEATHVKSQYLDFFIELLLTPEARLKRPQFICASSSSSF